MPARTYPGYDPQCFILAFTDCNDQIRNVITLSVYDVAEECLSDADTFTFDYYNVDFISNSKGIVFLIDPLQIPNVREKANGKIFLPHQYDSITDTLIQVIHKIRNIKEMIDIPIAVVLSKIDVLEDLDMISQDSILRCESHHYSNEKERIEINN